MKRRPQLLLLLITIIAAITCAYAAEPKSAGRAIAGTIISCDDSVLMVSVGDIQLPVAVALESDTVVSINGATAKIADIKPGGNVIVHQVDGITKRLDIRTKKAG